MSKSNYSAYMAIKNKILEIVRSETFEKNKLPSEAALANRERQWALEDEARAAYYQASAAYAAGSGRSSKRSGSGVKKEEEEKEKSAAPSRRATSGMVRR